MMSYNSKPYDLNRALEFKNGLDYIKYVSHVKCQDEIPGASDCIDGEQIHSLTQVGLIIETIKRMFRVYGMPVLHGQKNATS